MESKSNRPGNGPDSATGDALQRLADRLPYVIYRYEFSPVRRFAFVSRAAERMTGYTPAEHYANPDLGLDIVQPEDRKILEQLIRGELEFERPLLLRWIRKDGRVLWTEQFNVAIRDEQGRLIAIEGLARDVTNTHESALTLESICRAIRDLVIVLDRDGVYRYISPARADLLYRPAPELLGQRLHDVFPPDLADLFLEAIRATLRSGGPSVLEYSLEINQRTTWFEASIAPFGMDATVWLIRDVSDRIERTRELERAQQFALAVLDALASSICVLDRNLNIIMVNRSWRTLAEQSGVDPNDVGPGHLYAEVCRFTGGPGPDHWPALEAGLREVMAGQRLEFVLEYPAQIANEVRWFLARGAPCPGAGEGILIIGHLDISERRRAENALRDSESRYRNLFTHSPNPIVVDINGKIDMANQATHLLFGLPPDGTLIGRSLDDFLTPESRPVYADAVHETREGGIVLPSVELTFTAADGSKLVTEARMAPFRFGGGGAIHIMLHDITATRAAERERRRLATAIEQAAEAIVITDPQAHILYVNPAFERITGYSREEVLGQTPAILKSGRHPVEFYRELWSAITAGRTWRGHLINRRRDGRLYTEEATISPVTDESGRIMHFVAVKRDVTTELQMQAQLEQARRLELVGQMAGGVAHDFNNVLSVVLGESDLLLKQVEEGHPFAASLRVIRQAAEHGAVLAKQLLGFARQQPRQSVPISLNAAIQRCLPLLHGLAGDRIKIVWRPAPNLWPVQLDPSQFDEILLNLMSNARDAISNHGTVTIETANVYMDKAECLRHIGMTAGDYVQLSFSDDGCGMSPDVLAHAFEPYFTTKEVGHGSGLGLSIVHGIVQQSGGHIALTSEVGKGTRVDIWLPRAVGVAFDNGDTTEVSSKTSPSNTIRARILVCEDQASILSLVQRMLQRSGHQVVGTTDPREALRLVEQASQPPDMLITDLTMPHMDGRELALRIRAMHPGIKCLYMSGRSDELSSLEIRTSSEQILHKPFTGDELIRMVEQVLRAREMDSQND